MSRIAIRSGSPISKGGNAPRQRRISLSLFSACIDSPTPAYLLGAVLGSTIATFVLLIVGALL